MCSDITRNYFSFYNCMRSLISVVAIVPAMVVVGHPDAHALEMKPWRTAPSPIGVGTSDHSVRSDVYLIGPMLAEMEPVKAHIRSDSIQISAAKSGCTLSFPMKKGYTALMSESSRKAYASALESAFPGACLDLTQEYGSPSSSADIRSGTGHTTVTCAVERWLSEDEPVGEFTFKVGYFESRWKQSHACSRLENLRDVVISIINAGPH